MKDRIEAHESRCNSDRLKLLKSLQSESKALHSQLRERFFDALQTHVYDLQQQTEMYFDSVINHSTELCQIALKRLYLEISDTQKVESVLREVVEEYRAQQNVELVLPASISLKDLDLNLPEEWVVSNDPTLAPHECRLKLDFGEVVGNFDESFKALYDLVSGQNG